MLLQVLFAGEGFDIWMVFVSLMHSNFNSA